MSGWLYRLLIGSSQVMGVWIIALFAWIVSTGYFLFLPARVSRSMEFYKAVFPERGWWSRLGLTWRQFHRFAGLFAERVRLARGGPIERIDEGFERIEGAAEAGTGGVLLMSHVGGWEVAARLFSAEGVKLMLFMGEREREQIERMQKGDLESQGIHVQVASAGGEGDFSVVEGLRFIQAGGMVSFAGDRHWHGGQRAVDVQFFGRKVTLPAGPHLFALATSVPVFTFFALRTARHQYHLVAYGPRKVQARSRADRWEAVERSAQEYAHMLEDVVRRFPTHWFHFEPFLGPPWEAVKPEHAGPADAAREADKEEAS